MISRSARHSSPARSGFTIIELMIVLVIILILAGFLLGAVQNAIVSARQAEVVADMKNLEQAIKNFNSQFGADPPSGIVLYEENTDWSTSTPANAALVKKMFPEYLVKVGVAWNATADVDINGDGDAVDVITLNGAEALAFFCGGVCATNIVDQNGMNIGPVNGTVTTWDPLGFSRNPANPFARGGSRIGPFTEFQTSRFVDVLATDADKMPEYLDTLSGQTAPYYYFSSYGGKGYRTGMLYADDDLTGADSFTPYVTASMAPLNPNSFQLISPGYDGVHGNGGIDPTATIPDVEQDNITNFKNGRLK